jgi:hypothetical protein
MLPACAPILSWAGTETVSDPVLSGYIPPTKLLVGEARMTTEDDERAEARFRRFVRIATPIVLVATSAAAKWAQEAFDTQEKAQRAIDFLIKHLSVEGLEIGIGTAIVIIGLYLYRFRSRRPSWYGVVEIAVGWFIALQIIDQMRVGTTAPTMNGFFTAAGALYVIVRGCDNVYRGMSAGTVATRRWNQWFFGVDTDRKL